MAQLQATTVAGVVTDLRTENITTSSRNIATTDRNKVVACTNTSDITITIAADATVNFPIGSVVYIARFGSGAVALAAGGGVNVSRVGNLTPGEEIYVRKRADNTWITVDQPRGVSGAGGDVSSAGGFTVHTFTSSGTFTLS